MAFDYKKEYKEFYMPKKKPSIVEVPPMNYIAVRGKGDPNEENGEYKKAIGLLYAIAFTIKMSYKGAHKIEGYFEYVVPPLEGFWWQDGIKGMDYGRKEELNFISVIRLPDFVTKEEFDWAIEEATKKKNEDFSKVEFFTYEEGACVQCMHIGPYDEEPATVEMMHEFMRGNGYELDITDQRLHHEIYLSDPRRCDASKLKTVVRHPIKKREADTEDMRLKKQLDFILEIDKEKNIFRQTHLSGHGRNENDAEHAWHMAIMAYLLQEYSNEPVDVAKVMLMCLIHDVVEIDAGDTYAYDTENLKTQKAREDAAKERIYSILPDDQKEVLCALFDEFEENRTAEAKFAHAMDNLQPLLLNHSNDGGDWREHEVTAEQVYTRQSKSREGSQKLYEVTDRILQEHIKKGNLII